MGNSSEKVSLVDLRARRDRELVAIIGNTIERGIHLLRGDANASVAGPRRAQAERAYAEAVNLWPLVYRFSDPEGRQLERMLAELRLALDAPSKGEARQVRTAAS